MRFVIIVLHGASEQVMESPPRGWSILTGGGCHGRVLLVREEEGPFLTLPLLGYPPGALGEDLGACHYLGRGQEPQGVPALPAVDPFQTRTSHRAAWISGRVRSRGIARALGLAIYESAEPLAEAYRRIEDHDLVFLEQEETMDEEVLVPLAESATLDLRVAIVAVAGPGQWSPYVVAGGGMAHQGEELPAIDRGEELLGRLLTAFHV